MEISKFIDHSSRLEYGDLDWELAQSVGLTDAEKTILTYFADVEGQTIFYLRELLGTNAAKDNDTITFLTMWNYEEFFHGHALGKLLEVCGAPLGDERNAEVRVGAKFAAKAEEIVQNALSRIFPETFITLYMAWGASQELLTLRGYERIAKTTTNPVLSTLCDRIAKQERRHFAWYFNSARERLATSRFSQRLVRTIFEKFWTPVGVGVKSKAEAAELVALLFPGDVLPETFQSIDAKLGSWPGMEGFDVMDQFASKLIRHLPAPQDEVYSEAASSTV